MLLIKKNFYTISSKTFPSPPLRPFLKTLIPPFYEGWGDSKNDKYFSNNNFPENFTDSV